MRRVPSATSRTRPASFSTLRCCETAGRLTGKLRARSPTALGPSARRSKISRRVASPRADSPRRADLWLTMAYGKLILTIMSRTHKISSSSAAFRDAFCGTGKKYKHCCLAAESASMDSPATLTWRRVRRAAPAIHRGDLRPYRDRGSLGRVHRLAGPRSWELNDRPIGEIHSSQRIHRSSTSTRRTLELLPPRRA